METPVKKNCWLLNAELEQGLLLMHQQHVKNLIQVPTPRSLTPPVRLLQMSSSQALTCMSAPRPAEIRSTLQSPQMELAVCMLTILTTTRQAGQAAIRLILTSTTIQPAPSNLILNGLAPELLESVLIPQRRTTTSPYKLQLLLHLH